MIGCEILDRMLLVGLGFILFIIYLLNLFILSIYTSSTSPDILERRLGQGSMMILACFCFYFLSILVLLVGLSCFVLALL